MDLFVKGFYQDARKRSGQLVDGELERGYLPLGNRSCFPPPIQRYADATSCAFSLPSNYLL